MTDSILELRKVSKSYRAKPVLRDLEFSVPKGSVVGLLGKNGAGKTTLLRCALGLARPDQGEAFLLGEPASSLSDAARMRLGYAPQQPCLLEWMKVGQLLNYTRAFYPRWNPALIDRLVKDWELSWDARVGTLSPGEAQKLSILMALGHEPELLVLDEPAASLDPSARRAFLKALLDIAGGGERTILFSTHLTPDLERVADRVAILKDGRLTWNGGLDELKDSVKRLVLTVSRPLPKDLRIPGMLRLELSGARAIVTVQGVDEALIHGIEAQYGATVQVQDLNLEDIFMEVHHG